MIFSSKYTGISLLSNVFQTIVESESGRMSVNNRKDIPPRVHIPKGIRRYHLTKYRPMPTQLNSKVSIRFQKYPF